MVIRKASILVYGDHLLCSCCGCLPSGWILFLLEYLIRLVSRDTCLQPERSAPCGPTRITSWIIKRQQFCRAIKVLQNLFNYLHPGRPRKKCMLLHIRRIQDERYIAIVSGEHVIVNCPQEKGFAGHSRFFLLTDTCRLVNTGPENIGTANTIITMAPSPAHYSVGSGIVLPQCNVTESDTGCCKQSWCRGIFPRRTCLPAEYPLVSQRSVSPCKCCINCF